MSMMLPHLAAMIEDEAFAKEFDHCHHDQARREEINEGYAVDLRNFPIAG